MLLICAATWVEAAACWHASRSRASRVEVLWTGMGLARARRALETRLAAGVRPALVISAGFAGSHASDARVGDWILATEARQAGFEAIACRTGLARALKRTSLRWRKGPVLTLERIAGRERRIFEGVAHDLETHALSRVASRFGIGFSALRMVSDTWDFPLPTRAREGVGFALRAWRYPAELRDGWREILGQTGSQTTE